MAGQTRAIANNAIAYIWWRLDAKIDGCLGFSVRRVEANGNKTALPAFVGFKPGVPGAPRLKKNTDIWPVQSFQWKDVFASPGIYSYEIVPMMGPDMEALTPHPTIKLLTRAVDISGDYGNLEAYFNVGLISTQSITRQLRQLVESGVYANKTDALRGEIAKPGSTVRVALAGEVLDKGVLALLNKCGGPAGGHCHLGLYELTDGQLINAIKTLAAKKRLDLCLSNADQSESFTGEDGNPHTRKVHDGTNAAARADLVAQGVPVFNRFVASSGIGHNKYIVWSRKNGTPRSVLTGSTNWTSTGLCSQTNNALLIHNDTVAQGYRDYWDWLVWDAEQKPVQGKDMREWCGADSVDATVGGASVSVWLSPNTARRTKDANAAPPDLAEVFELIRQARHGILFLAFNPGTPSFLDVVRERALAMEAASKPFYVRGAVTAPAPVGEFATFLTKRRAGAAPDVLVSGVAGVPDDFSFWEEEMYKLGHAVIHDKIIVIDPFTEHSVVVTGSHNLGYKASYQNDENLVIVRGHERLAQAYAAHCLDITNHFAWRVKLSDLHRKGKLNDAWGDLADTDSWQNKYFDNKNDASRDSFFFFTPP